VIRDCIFATAESPLGLTAGICGLWHNKAGRKSPLRTFGSGRRVGHVEIDGFRGRVTHFGIKQNHS
jgi:hypothetical protein